MDSVSQALKSARATTLDGQICHEKVVDQTGLSRSTLSRRDRGVTIPRTDATNNAESSTHNKSVSFART